MSQTHREYFNQQAADWHEKMPDDPALRDLLIRFGISENDHVLDIGAGTGRMTRHIAKLVGESGLVVSEDIAEEMLVQGDRLLKGKHIYFTCDDTCALAFKKNSFDKILCFSAFPHFQNKQAALSEMFRVLKPDGRLLILHDSSSKNLNAFHATLDGVVCTDHLPPAKEIGEMMKHTGFDVTNVLETDHIYWVEGVKNS